MNMVNMLINEKILNSDALDLLAPVLCNADPNK